MLILIISLFILSILLWVPCIIAMLKHNPLDDLTTLQYTGCILGCTSAIIAIVLWILEANL